jgi:hypothetical protein
VREYERVRRIALALPEVNERLSHGEPCFFVRNKRPLCYFHDNHDGDGRISLWCPVPPGVQEELVATEPERFFRPPTSARGVFATWLGMYLDTAGDNRVDWNEVAAIVKDAFRAVAPPACRRTRSQTEVGPTAADLSERSAGTTGRLVRVKSGVVEGEPGIFPDPIARALRALGRFFSTRRGEMAKSTEDLEADEPPQDGAQER